MQADLPLPELPIRARAKRRPNIAPCLLKSAISHMRVAVEFFNRLHQPHRHEIAAELAIAAWEKILKAFLYKRKQRIVLPNGQTLSFYICLDRTRSAIPVKENPAFAAAYENLKTTYQFRNESAHFYG